MGSHIVAKKKMKSLTARLEKSLYNLKYGDKRINILDNTLYDSVITICVGYNIPFPLIKVDGGIYLNCRTTNIFCTLSKLADNHNIIFDIEKVHY